MTTNGRPTDLDALLSAAIVAARGKQPAEARSLLRQVLIRDPTNTTAWLWMSGVVDDPLKREACLQKVLEFDPDNHAARRGLLQAQRAVAENLLAEGTRAAKAGRTALAHKLFTDVIVRDERNLDAWMWLSRVVEDDEDLAICYDNILMLDPENEEAQVGMALLETRRQRTEAVDWEVVDGALKERVASTLAGDVLGEAYREKHTTALPAPEPPPASPAQALWERYEDPYRCPYCTAKTAPEDRRCPTCRSPLWIKSRARETRSVLLWILIAFQAASTALAATLPLLAALLVGAQVGVADGGQWLAAYLGMPHDLAPAALARAHETLSPVVFWLLFLPALFGALVTIGLFFRWPVIFYGMLGSALLVLVGSLAGIAFAEGNLLALGVSAIGIALAIANVAIVLKLEDDFKIRRVRLLLRLDPGLKTGMDTLRRGRTYASHAMWGQAALHFRRAAALMPAQVDGLVGLAKASKELSDLDLAEWALENALERIPDHPRLQAELEALHRRHGE